MRRRRQRHHESAALEIVDLLFDHSVFGAGDISRRIGFARVVDGLAVVAEPRFKGVSDAGGHHQPVVIDITLCGMQAAGAAVDVADLGLHEGVAVAFGRRHIGMHQELGVDDVDQPLVAERAGPEHGIAFEQYDFEVGRLRTKMTGRSQTTPAAAGNDHAALARLRHQRGRGRAQQGLCGQRRGRECGGGRAGLEDCTT